MATLSFTPKSGDWTAYVNIPYSVSYDRSQNKTTVTFTQASVSYYGRQNYGTRMDCTIRVTATDNSTYKETTLTTYGYTQGSAEASFTGTPNPSTVTVTHTGTGTKNVTIKATCTIKVYMYSYSDTQSSISGNKSVTVTAGSRFTLSISQGTGSTITVTRSGSALSDGALLSSGESLVISFSTNTGYNLGTHNVNGSTFTSGNTHSVSGNVAIVSTATAITYPLSINQGANTIISVNRTSSPYGGGAEGYLNNGAVLYYGDSLSVTYSVSVGYTISIHTVNGTTFDSGSVYTVSSEIEIITTAILNTYSITSIIGEHMSLVIRRISSPLGGAASGIINNNATVYHGDELTITAVPNSGYGIESLTVNDAAVTSPHTIIVVSSIVIVVLAAALGFVHIDSGSSIDKYKIIIDSGSVMEQYRAMIDTGSEIVPY